MLLKPRKRTCPSDILVARSNTLRHTDGLKNGSKPSSTSISATAANNRSHMLVGKAYFFAAAGVVLPPPTPAPRIALKKSLDGSTTIMSDLLRKLAR